MKLPLSEHVMHEKSLAHSYVRFQSFAALQDLVNSGYSTSLQR